MHVEGISDLALIKPVSEIEDEEVSEILIIGVGYLEHVVEINRGERFGLVVGIHLTDICIFIQNDEEL